MDANGLEVLADSQIAIHGRLAWTLSCWSYVK